MADTAAEVPSDFVRIKRKKTIFFLYLEAEDTVHDLRARINHIKNQPHMVKAREELLASIGLEKTPL